MSHGFIWYELMTSDPDAAAKFYGAVIGWTAHGTGQPGMDYRQLKMGDSFVGGLMAMAEMPPMWVGYISVDDVDAAIVAIKAAGGAEHMPARDIPGVGRMAMVSDPQGAIFYVMAAIGDGPATSFAPGKVGHGGWHELHTTDWSAGFDFYKTQFGWEKVHAMDMGPMGTYLQFNFGEGDFVGGMMNDSQAPRPHWQFVFNVEDVTAAKSRIEAHGGETLRGPEQVPTGAWIVQAKDPQGAVFVVVGPKA